MDDILRVHQISPAIVELIEHSKKYCFLVSPYYKPWPHLTRAIEKAAHQSLRMVFLFRADGQNPSNLRLMEDLNKTFHFDVFFIRNLHSKLYLNENEVVLSSMNLLDSSQENNYEIGYHFKSSATAKRFFDQVLVADLFSLVPERHLPGRYAETMIDLMKNSVSLYQIQHKPTIAQGFRSHCPKRRYRCGTWLLYSMRKSYPS